MAGRPKTRVEAVLWELCVGYGHCLPPDEQAALEREPPRTVDGFVDAVLRAEGVDPDLYDRQARLQLRQVVADWLFEVDGRGARSGLP